MTILLIEGGNEQRDLIRGLLSAEGGQAFELHCASGLNEGIAELLREDVDVVLLDLHGGRSNGLSDLDRLRKRVPGVPVVALTNSGDEAVGQALQRGAQDALPTNELNAALLARSLRYAVERKRAEEQLTVSRKMESIGQLAAGIAHEINTPVQYIGDSVHFLQDCYSDFLRLLDKYHALRLAASAGRCDPLLVREAEEIEQEVDLDFLRAEAPRAFRRTLDGIERVTHVVRAVKEFSYPSPREQAAADLNQAIEDALTVARNEYKYVADVQTDLAELPPVVCHIGDLNQVLLNLIVNASQAISQMVGESGGRGQIRISTRREGEQVVILIADTGCGIPRELHSRIFDPFFTTKSVGKGTGQGLAIAHSIIVDKHGGSLSFESAPGQGTSFLIRLPVNGALLSQSGAAL